MCYIFSAYASYFVLDSILDEPKCFQIKFNNIPLVEILSFIKISVSDPLTNATSAYANSYQLPAIKFKNI